MTTYVVDASVAARFLLTEEWSDRAVSLLESFSEGIIDLKAPRLVDSEVGNTLWKATRTRRVSVQDASNKLFTFLKLKLGSIELSNEECKDALTWGAKNDATFYDSVYVIASKKSGAALLTADTVLYEKASKHVTAVHLRDLPM